MPHKFDSEAEMAKVVVDHLEKKGWEVWQEVQLYSGGPIADIVAQKEGVLLIVECKRSFGYRLISDAMNWVGYADRVAIAYPQRKFGDKNTENAAAFMINLYKIEEWKVAKSAYRGYSDTVRPGTPKPQESPLKESVLKTLRDEHKEWAKAGVQNARRVSKFQITCYHLERYVQSNKGVTLKKAVPEIAHHYASDNSAYGALADLISAGHVRGIKHKGRGRSMKLYPKEEMLNGSVESPE